MFVPLTVRCCGCATSLLNLTQFPVLLRREVAIESGRRAPLPVSRLGSLGQENHQFPVNSRFAGNSERRLVDPLLAAPPLSAGSALTQRRSWRPQLCSRGDKRISAISRCCKPSSKILRLTK